MEDGMFVFEEVEGQVAVRKAMQFFPEEEARRTDKFQVLSTLFNHPEEFNLIRIFDIQGELIDEKRQEGY